MQNFTWKLLKDACCLKESNVSLDNFENYFRAINCPESRFYNTDEDVLDFIYRYEQNKFDVIFDELNVPFSHKDVTKAIKQLHNNKSGGPDLFINEIFIHGRDVLTPFLLSLFNKVFDIGYFPQCWSEGFIIPLHKKGSLNDVNK